MTNINHTRAKAALQAAGCRHAYVPVMTSIVIGCQTNANITVAQIITNWKAKRPEWFTQ
jgi:hypothetical protein